MTDDGEPLLLKDAAPLVGCSLHALNRWIGVGLPQRGTGKVIKLESTWWLNKRYVTLAAVARFRAAIQRPAEEPIETPAQRKRDAAAVKRALLERHGVGAKGGF